MSHEPLFGIFENDGTGEKLTRGRGGPDNKVRNGPSFVGASSGSMRSYGGGLRWPYVDGSVPWLAEWPKGHRSWRIRALEMSKCLGLCGGATVFSFRSKPRQARERRACERVRAKEHSGWKNLHLHPFIAACGPVDCCSCESAFIPLSDGEGMALFFRGDRSGGRNYRPFGSSCFFRMG